MRKDGGSMTPVAGWPPPGEGSAPRTPRRARGGASGTPGPRLGALGAGAPEADAAAAGPGQPPGQDRRRGVEDAAPGAAVALQLDDARVRQLLEEARVRADHRDLLML